MYLHVNYVKMGGMVEVKGKVIAKHTSAHTLLEVQCFNM